LIPGNEFSSANINVIIALKKYRTHIFTIGFIIILLLAVFLVRRYGGFSVSSDDFAVNRTDRVTLVILEKDGEQLVLQKKESGWIVNNLYEARPVAIRNLLETLSRLSIKSTVPETLFQKEWENNSGSVIRVQVRERPGGNKSFLVYPVQSNPYGNYFKKREKGTPYIINIPGYSGNVGSLFITNEKFWLPTTIYSFQPSRIKMIEMLNFEDESKSFVIHQDTIGSLRILSIPDKEPIENIDTSQVYRYLSYFTNLKFERWVVESDSVDFNSVLSTQPMHRLSITDQSGNTIRLSTYPIYRGSGNGSDIDLNRIYARINEENELVIIKFVDIDPVLKDRSYFGNNSNQ